MLFLNFRGETPVRLEKALIKQAVYTAFYSMRNTPGNRNNRFEKIYTIKVYKQTKTFKKNEINACICL
jgi:hypothetical protein